MLLKPLNLLEFLCSHLILCIRLPLCPLSVIASLAEGSCTGEFHFLLLPDSFSQARRLPLFLLLPLTAEKFIVSISLLLAIHLVSTSPSEAKEEKAYICTHIKGSSSAISQGPPNLGVSSWMCFLFLSSHILFYSMWDQGFSAATKPSHSSRPWWNPHWMICLDRGGWLSDLGFLG